MDFAFIVPQNIQIEDSNQSRDCVTWGVSNSDDD